MPKLISFQVPREGGNVSTEQGYVVHLRLNDTTTHKFVMQLDISKPTLLADYRTGYRLGSFGGMVLARYVSNPYAYTDSISGTYRKIAQEFLTDIIARVGLERVQSELAKHPTLNK